jgi:hypothetical protein
MDIRQSVVPRLECLFWPRDSIHSELSFIEDKVSFELQKPIRRKKSKMQLELVSNLTLFSPRQRPQKIRRINASSEHGLDTLLSLEWQFQQISISTLDFSLRDVSKSVSTISELSISEKGKSQEECLSIKRKRIIDDES